MWRGSSRLAACTLAVQAAGGLCYDCSCSADATKGIGQRMPGIGYLTCRDPVTCGEHCSQAYVEPCIAEAHCSLKGNGTYRCNCETCKGPTVEYAERCQPGTCPDSKSCFYRGCRYKDSGGKKCIYALASSEEVSCLCDSPYGLDATGTCTFCPGNRTRFDPERNEQVCAAPAAITLVPKLV